MNDTAIQSLTILKKRLSAQETYLEYVDRWNKFANLSQWSTADEKKLKAFNLPVITHDFILPAVEQGVSFLTFNSPRFHAIGVTSDDTELGMNVSDLAAHMWKISTGDMEFKQHVYDYYVKGLGWWLIYDDPEADEGRGELKIQNIDPRNVVVDENSQDILCRDASDISYHKTMTRRQAKLEFPDLEEEIDKAQSSINNSTHNTSSIQSKGGFTEYGDFSVEENDKLDYIERYEKVNRVRHRLLFNDDGTEIGPLTEKEYKAAQEATYGLVNTGEKMDIIPGAQAEEIMQNPQMGILVEFMTLDELIEAELVVHAKYNITRVMKYTSIGDYLISEEELPISEYPLVPTFNKHNGNPFPLSDVAGAIGAQEYANKMISLVTEHTQRSVSAKVLFPRGMANRAKIEEMLTRPGPGAEEYNGEAVGTNGTAGIINLQPAPLANAAFGLIADAKHHVEYQFGIFENMMGSGMAAPETFKGTMAIDDFGQRRMRSKLQSLERTLSFAGTVWLEWARSYYTIEKTVRISEPGTDPKETIFNQDERIANEYIRKNDLSRAYYDLTVAAGSSTPVNRWAQNESMKEIIFQGGIHELLPTLIRNMDIENAEKVAQQVEQRGSMQAQIQQLEEKLKDVTGDLQTARREALQDEKARELMKWTTELDKVMNELKANAEVQETKATAKIQIELQKVLDAIKSTEIQDRETSLSERI